VWKRATAAGERKGTGGSERDSRREEAAVVYRQTARLQDSQR
jgi:hypothetical protein